MADLIICPGMTIAATVLLNWLLDCFGIYVFYLFIDDISGRRLQEGDLPLPWF